MNQDALPPDASAAPGTTGHGVVAGFGVPGRAVADLLHARGMTFCVIERNAETVERCRKSGLCMVEGDAGDAASLRAAGLDRAALFACTVPNDEAMYAAVMEARRLNPRVRIIARCRFVSSGIEASRLGADDVVVEEHAVAQAFEGMLATVSQTPPPPPALPR